MKKILVLCILHYFMFFSSQNFTFDYLVTTESQRKKPKIKPMLVQNFVNSEDDSYILQVYPESFAFLFDYKTNMRHLFEIQNEQDISKFIYKNSEKITFSEKYYFDVKKINDSEFLLQSFFNKKKKNVRFDMKIKVKEAPANLIVINADIGFPEKKAFVGEVLKNLDSNKNYIIEESYSNNYKGFRFDNKLKNYFEKQLLINVPKEIIIY